MSRYKNKILITTGDINGIGTEITIKALNIIKPSTDKVAIVTNKRSLALYEDLLSEYEIIDIPYNDEVKFGEITPESGEFSFNSLKKACELRPQAIVTAPVSKEALHKAGHKFNGQTEILDYFLAHDGQKAEMLFVSKGFNVFLLTRHCALTDVPKLITEKMLVEKIERLNTFFKNTLHIQNPKFALCSLNPHAGEGGILGEEEIKTVIPAIDKLRKMGISITNPLPSDTLFVEPAKAYFEGKPALYDCYIAMYHDQGLIPIKTVAGSDTVNMTIGLDIIRTSPSHGTAFDIAGRHVANPSSMISAIKEVLY